jgi:NodT family efflux transporter outer membrane factor (OMF) lipoprotein
VTRTIALVASLGLAACAVGPDYTRSDRALPPAWSEAPAAAQVDPALALADWWERFEDPLLTSLVERAARANLDVRVASARVREADALEGVAGSEQWPALDLRADAYGGTGRENSTALGVLALFYEIDVFGRVRRNVEAARADQEAAWADRRAVLLAVVADVATTYVQLRGLQHGLATVQRNLASQRETLDLTDAQRRVGLASDLEVERATALSANTASVLPPLEAELAAAKHRLALLLGEPPAALHAELAGEAPIPAPPAEVVVGVPAELLRRRPDVARAERELAAATARIGAAKAELYPRLTLVGSIGLRSEDVAQLVGGNTLGTLGPSVEWPIFAGGRILANVAAQDARAEQAALRYEETVLAALEQVESALARHAREQVRRRDLRRAVDAQREAVELAQRLYFNGLGPFLEVLDAERSLFASEALLSESETAVGTTAVALYAALGGGWERAEALALP